MSANAFFDSNVLIYLTSPEPLKAARARALVNAGGTVSVQVLNEFVNVCRRKFGRPFHDIREALRNIRQLCTVLPLDIQTHERGLAIAERYQFKLYDSLIIASAQLAGCATLYTEDLQHGQSVDGLTIRNPFTA